MNQASADGFEPRATREAALLGGKLRYLQFTTGHRSGFEPVLLAASIPAKPGDHVLEAGTGAGATLLCLGQRVPGLTALGVEISRPLAALANENFKINGFSSFSCICDDIVEAAPGATFDHVMANPPWHEAAGTGSPDAGRALAHRAPQDLIPRWVAAMSASLKPRGSLTLILPAARASEALTALRRHRYGAIGLFPLWPRHGQPAKLLLIGARLGARGADRIFPGLILHDEGGISEAAQTILRGGGATALGQRSDRSKPSV